MLVEERFWTKVDVRGPDDCWLWLASVSSNDYGQFYFEGGPRLAHVVALILAGVEIPEGWQVDHIWPRCTSYLCCNPRHLEPVSQLANLERQAEALRSKPCRKGHPPSARRLRSDGVTECGTCVRDYDKQRYAANPEPNKARARSSYERKKASR